jgi:cleavage and polyadenylation specificity factor subunit 2
VERCVGEIVVTPPQTNVIIGKGKGIVITPYPAGRTLGGAIWKITKEAEDIVYAVDYNHKKERHLNPTMLETLLRPTLLITDARQTFVQHAPRKDRDKKLTESILTTLRGGGCVLLPTDTAGRALELLLLLDPVCCRHRAHVLLTCQSQLWSHHELAQQYPLAFYNNVAINVLEFAKSQLEWQADDIARRFEVIDDGVVGDERECV